MRPTNEQSSGGSEVARIRAAEPRACSVTSVSPFLDGVSDPIVLRKGLRFPSRLGFDKWFEIGRRLSFFNTSSAWCLGDWLVYGETAFEGRYRKAIEETMLDYQTLRNYAWVARRFPLSHRRDTLSFGHHAEVAAMPESEREYWLRKAEELSWSRNMLRRQVRESLRMRKQGGKSQDRLENPRLEERESVNYAKKDAELQAQAHNEAVLEIALNREKLDTLETAASLSGTKLESWALRVLEGAASAALNEACSQ